MSIIEIVSLFGIMVVLAALPSSSVALVVTRSVTLGVSNGIAVAIGIVLGDLVFILLAFFGLSVVAETMGGLFIVIKYLGATYLLWLGYQLLTSKKTTVISVDKKTEKRNLTASLLAGFILTLGDVKAIVFYVSLLPVFIDLTAFNVTDILVMITVMIISLGSVKILYALSANKVIAMARDFIIFRSLDNAVKKTAGAFMIGAGSYLIVKA